MIFHPQTDLHYVHVFPGTDVFREVYLCYKKASERLPWMSAKFVATYEPEFWNRDIMLIFWHEFPYEIPAGRRSKIALRWTESAGNGLQGDQASSLERFKQVAPIPDLVLCGCPSVMDFVRPMVRRVGLHPIGYDPEIMGWPNWACEKKYDVAFYGSPCARRDEILGAVRKLLGDRFVLVNSFGMDRKAVLDQSRSVLYVGHSRERSFPGMRIWQAISSSAALLTEERDAWPAVRGTHYVSLADPMRPNLPDTHSEYLGVFLARLERALATGLGPIAQKAHDDLRAYTVERCMEYVVQASRDLR